MELRPRARLEKTDKVCEGCANQGHSRMLCTIILIECHCYP